MNRNRCIIQNVHIDPDETTDAKDAQVQEQLELLLAKLICKELDSEFVEYQVS